MADNLMHLYGKNSVLERLKNNPKSIRKIFLQENFSDLEIQGLIKSNRVSSQIVNQKQLYKIKLADSHQGIVAQVNKFEYTDFSELVDLSKPEQLSLIFLDRIFDPQNLGSIIRTAACFGGFAIIIPRHRACEVTDAVLHVACGGENFVPISIVSNLSLGLREAKDRGYWVVGSVVEGGKDIREFELPFPLCFVLGSEGAGIRYGVQKCLDFNVHIPMPGASLSLNVGRAWAIFCYEIARQRQK